jgi:hypothetical protein
MNSSIVVGTVGQKNESPHWVIAPVNKYEISVLAIPAHRRVISTQ